MFTRLLLLLLGSLSLSFATASAAPQAWPFGIDPDDPRARNRDLYNLGLLGAKATDAIAGEPQPGTGLQRFEGVVEEGPDRGPRKLRIECLYPDGPAATAGLQVGDVVVGLGSKEFKDGYFEPLADALIGAASAKKAKKITLRVEREGERGVLKIAVPIEPLDKLLAKPSKPGARALLATPALAWLAERQGEDGGFPQTLGGMNGAVVQTCMAGLAWITSGSSLESGPYAENLAKAVTFVNENVGAKSGLDGQTDSNWNQENWGWVHAGIFFGELHHAAPNEELAAKLQRVLATIQGNQEASGGYAHGPGGPNALGYVELNIVGGLALCALGLGRQAGCTIDEEKVELLKAYIEASSGDGVGYSTKDGQRGIANIGRSASTWLGYRTLGEGKDKFAARLAGYVKRNASEVLGGHASLMQHILFAGLAAQAQGGAAEKSYWSTMVRDLVIALSPDGSFQPRPWSESLRMASNSDVSFGEVWTTACWTCVLAGQPPKKGTGGLPALLGD